MPGNIRTDHLTHRAGPAAGTPDSGTVVMYAKSDGEYYKKDDLGNEVTFLTGQLYSNTDSSTVITNTLSETAFDTKKVISGGTLVPGRIIHLNASVIVTGVAGSDGLDLRLKLGAHELVLVQQATATATMMALFDLTIHILDGGGAASDRTVLVYGSVFFAVPGGSMLAHRVLVLSADVTGDLDLRLTAEWEAAQIGNTVKCESFSISVE